MLAKSRLLRPLRQLSEIVAITREGDVHCSSSSSSSSSSRYGAVASTSTSASTQQDSPSLFALHSWRSALSSTRGTTSVSYTTQAHDEGEEQDDDASSEDYPEGEEGIKLQILEAALEHVKSKGWSQDALRAAAIDLGYSPAFAGVLPRGEAELIEHFILKCNRKMEEDLAKMQPEYHQQGMPARIEQAVKLRLQMLIPYIDTWPQALAVLASPQNATHTLNLMQDLVDSIWIAAGDKSTDLSWYSKRMLLAGAYSATELYMLTDCSPGFSDTWEALHRRISDAIAFGGLMRNVQDTLKRPLRAPT